MEQFIKQHSDCTLGVLEGFDRVLSRGTLRSLCHPDGVNKFLAAKGVPFKKFADFTEGLTDQIAGRAGCARSVRTTLRCSKPYCMANA